MALSAPIAFGIGASEVAHVLMTQTLWQKRPQADAHHDRRRARRGHVRQGSRADDHRAHRRRRRAGPCDRICGLGRARAVDGRAHDALQSLDRGGRAARTRSRPTRRPSPLCAAVRSRPRARRSSARVEDWRRLAQRRRRRVRHARSSLDAREVAPTVTWGVSPEQAAPIDADDARSRRNRRRGARGGGARRARLYGSGAAARR